jgi:hypothetical protein
LLCSIRVRPGAYRDEWVRKHHKTGCSPTVPVADATESSYYLVCSSRCRSPGWLPSLNFSTYLDNSARYNSCETRCSDSDPKHQKRFIHFLTFCCS